MSDNPFFFLHGFWMTLYFMKFFYVFRYKTRSIWVNTDYAFGMTSGVAVTECFSALLVFPQQIQGLRAQENPKTYGTFKASYLTGCSVLSSGVLMQTKYSQSDNEALQTGTVKTICYTISDTYRPVILMWSLRSREENKSR